MPRLTSYAAPASSAIRNRDNSSSGTTRRLRGRRRKVKERKLAEGKRTGGNLRNVEDKGSQNRDFDASASNNLKKSRSILEVMEGASDAELSGNLLPYQKIVRKMYYGFYAQVTVAICILLNYCLTLADSQLLPEKEEDMELAKTIDNMERAFTYIFTIELLINFYGGFLWIFFLGPDWMWNMFDLLVVSASWVSSGSSFGILRMLRAARVARMFGRVASFRMIVDGIFTAVPAVTHAFVVLIIFMCVWAIFGVVLFGDDAEDLFGTFPRAMLTLFQMLTGDSWCSHITRTIIAQGVDFWLAATYSIFFVFAGGMVIWNLVVAILLEKYLQIVKENKMKKTRANAMKKLGVKGRAMYRRQSVNISTRGVKLFSQGRVKWPRALRKCAAMNCVVPYGDAVGRFYDSDRVQLFFGLCILINFGFGCADTSYNDDADSNIKNLFDNQELVFSIIFSLELLINYYGHFPIEFFVGKMCYWNIFDVLLVSVSWALMGSRYTTFRVMRALRIVRMFKKVESLRRIVMSLLICIPKMMAAFLITVILTSMWAIVGVHLYREEVPNEFGDLGLAFLTMWQVLTSDSWASGDRMARYLIFDSQLSQLSKDLVVLFFVSYIFIVGMIMINVIITLLLEGYLSSKDPLFESGSFRSSGSFLFDRTRTMESDLISSYSKTASRAESLNSITKPASAPGTDNRNRQHSGDTAQGGAPRPRKAPESMLCHGDEAQARAGVLARSWSKLKTNGTVLARTTSQSIFLKQKDQDDNAIQILSDALGRREVQARLDSNFRKKLLTLAMSNTSLRKGLEVLLHEQLTGVEHATIMSRLRGDDTSLFDAPYPEQSTMMEGHFQRGGRKGIPPPPGGQGPSASRNADETATTTIFEAIAAEESQASPPTGEGSGSIAVLTAAEHNDQGGRMLGLELGELASNRSRVDGGSRVNDGERGSSMPARNQVDLHNDAANLGPLQSPTSMDHTPMSSYPRLSGHYHGGEGKL